MNLKRPDLRLVPETKKAPGTDPAPIFN